MKVKTLTSGIAIVMIILTIASMWAIYGTASAVGVGMGVKVGTYAGNGADNRSITGIGFSPEFVMVTAAGDPSFRTAAHSGDTSSYFSYIQANASNHIQSFLSDGFEIGSDDDVNSGTDNYYWMAINNNGAGDFVVGSYVGNGADNRSITGLGFRPDFVFIKQDGGLAQGVFTTSVMPADYSLPFDSASLANGTDNLIQALESDGFQVGSENDVNGSGLTHYYYAFKQSPVFAIGTYTGNGIDDRDITGVPFQPEAVFVKVALNDDAVWKSSAMSGLHSYSLSNYEDYPSNGIQAINADGFELGTITEVNFDTLTYYWVAFASGGVPPTETKTGVVINNARKVFNNGSEIILPI